MSHLLCTHCIPSTFPIFSHFILTVILQDSFILLCGITEYIKVQGGEELAKFI